MRRAFSKPTDEPVEMYRAALSALGPRLDTTQRYVRVGVSLHEFSPIVSHAGDELAADKAR